jgi:hypothetical protein
MKAFGIACVALVALALTGVNGSAYSQDGYDPDARTLLYEVLAEHQFVPWPRTFGSIFPGVFGLSEPLPEYDRRNEARALELFDALRDGKFQFVGPVERADRITRFEGYTSLKPACASHPVEFWNTADGRLVSAGELTKYKRRFPRIVVPYTPNLPRPVDYEIAYLDGQMIAAPATEGLALYRLPLSRSGGSDDTTYVLRAEEFAVPAKSGLEAAEIGWGIFAVFEHPSCVFRGAIDYVNRCTGVGTEQLRDYYIAEIIRMNNDYFALTVATAFCPGSAAGPRYEIVFWDLGVSTDSGGAKFKLVQQP